MAAEVDLTLNANTKKAEKAINGLKTAMKGLAAVAGVAAGAFAVKKITDAASEQERAVKSLNTALALTGEFSEETSKRFQNFASELQKNSTIGDEVALSMVGLTKSMGATNEQTEKIIQAATDLSAVTGETLESSVKNITKTLGGLKGELGETQPELAGLTAEQLKAGAAIEILGKKYKGAAKEMTKTFGGSIDQATNSFGDLLEEVGFLITESPLVIKAIGLTSKAFNDLGAFVKKNRKAIIDFSVDAIAGAVKALAFLIDRVGDVVAVMTNLEAVFWGIELSLRELALASVDMSINFIKSFKEIVNLAIEPLLSGVGALAEGLNSLGVVSDEQLAKFNQGLKDIALDSSSTGLEAMRADLEAWTNEARDSFIESADNLLETKDGFTVASDSVNAFADSLTAMKDVSDDSNKALKKLSKTNADLAKAPKPFAEREFLGTGKDAITGKSLISGGFAAIGGMTQGAAGAQGLLKAGATAAGTAFFGPEAGQAIGMVTDMLAKGPEHTKQMVEGFIEQIPVIIDNLAEALPVLVEVLADKSDVIIVALAEATPKVAEALAIQVPIALAKRLPPALGRILTRFTDGVKFQFDKIMPKIAAAFEKVYSEFPKKILEGLNGLLANLGISIDTESLKKIGSTIADGLMDGLKGLGSFFEDMFKNLDPGNLLEKIFKVDMGGRGKVEKALGIDVPFMSFARGGIVPGFAPFKGNNLKNDRVMAMLSPGEMVIPRSMMDDPFMQAIAANLPHFGFGGSIGSTISSATKNIGGAASDAVKAVTTTVATAAAPITTLIRDTLLGPLWDQVQKLVMGPMFDAMFEKNKFARGGEVPAGFSNDTFPSLLSSGENVVDRSTNQKLNEFLDGSSGGTKVVIQVGEQELASVLLNLNRQGFRTA